MIETHFDTSWPISRHFTIRLRGTLSKQFKSGYYIVYVKESIDCFNEEGIFRSKTDFALRNHSSNVSRLGYVVYQRNQAVRCPALLLVEKRDLAVSEYNAAAAAAAAEVTVMLKSSYYHAKCLCKPVLSPCQFRSFLLGNYIYKAFYTLTNM